MFLEKIVKSTQNRVEQMKGTFDFPFEKALKKEGISFICEVKKASPSKGIIAENFPYLDIAMEYEAAGAAAISVLTEPEFFMGSGDYLKDISEKVKIPTLRKDFIIDPMQIFEAKGWGASAVLLISEILSEEKLHEFIKLSECLGLSALVESHSLPMLKKSLACGAKIVGVNNRNLETFEVDIMTSVRLRQHVPENIVFVSESGINSLQDIALLIEHNVDAVLIGEALMRSNDKQAMLGKMRGCL